MKQTVLIHLRSRSSSFIRVLCICIYLTQRRIHLIIHCLYCPHKYIILMISSFIHRAISLVIFFIFFYPWFKTFFELFIHYSFQYLWNELVNYLLFLNKTYSLFFITFFFKGSRGNLKLCATLHACIVELLIQLDF